jgi:uncharacterized membrane protein (UPF0127 family)
MQVIINDNQFDVKCLFNQKDIQRGMMGKKFDGFDGLLFMMEPGEHSFWMKNCLVPLDIIFIKNDTISKIHHNCRPCNDDDCQNYSGIGDIVLELPGMTCKEFDISEGDKIFVE